MHERIHRGQGRQVFLFLYSGSLPTHVGAVISKVPNRRTPWNRGTVVVPSTFTRRWCPHQVAAVQSAQHPPRRSPWLRPAAGGLQGLLLPHPLLLTYFLVVSIVYISHLSLSKSVWLCPLELVLESQWGLPRTEVGIPCKGPRDTF